jgi:hypothetical protein
LGCMVLTPNVARLTHKGWASPLRKMQVENARWTGELV